MRVPYWDVRSDRALLPARKDDRVRMLVLQESYIIALRSNGCFYLRLRLAASDPSDPLQAGVHCAPPELLLKLKVVLNSVTSLLDSTSTACPCHDRRENTEFWMTTVELDSSIVAPGRS